MAVVQKIGTVAQNMPLDPVLATTRSIYLRYKGVKRNEKQCNQIKLMVEELEKALQPIEEKEWSEISENLKSALVEVKSVLESADEFIKKYTEANPMKLMVKSNDFLEEFNSLNQKLSGVLVTVCKAMREQLEEEQKKLAQKEAEVDEKSRILAQQEMIQHLEAQSFCVVM